MIRRDFIKTSVVTPLFLQQLLAENDQATANYKPGDAKSFELLEVKGSYQQIGYQIGRAFGKNIKKVIERRFSWHDNLLEILRSKKSRQRSKEYLRITEKHFPHLLDEIKGMADGAGLHFDSVWALCIKSELMAFDPEPTGCSTIFYSEGKNKGLFHNEDGHQAYDGQMFVINVEPPSGINYLYFVYPGTITGNGPGFNKEGIFQTTNYISSTKSKIGLPRYILGRAVLEVKTIKEAIEILTLEPRAYPYHHNIGSMTEGKYLSLETTPEKWEIQEPSEIYFHTNHLLFEKTKMYQFQDQDYINTSSLSRFQVIKDNIQNLSMENPRRNNILEILTSHVNAPYSPCRHPQGDVKGTTLATAWFDLENAKMRLFKNNPCKALSDNLFVDYSLNIF
jgi:predicted choloylglycine hydrolase